MKKNGGTSKSPNKIGANRQANGTFGPGNVANPNGRPEGSVSIVARAKQILREEPERLEEIARDLLEDEKLRVELIRQVDGMPIAKTVLSGDEDSPLVIVTDENKAK